MHRLIDNEGWCKDERQEESSTKGVARTRGGIALGSMSAVMISVPIAVVIAVSLPLTASIIVPAAMPVFPPRCRRRSRRPLLVAHCLFLSSASLLPGQALVDPSFCFFLLFHFFFFLADGPAARLLLDRGPAALKLISRHKFEPNKSQKNRNISLHQPRTCQPRQ
jgi:hypothetical protein